MKEAEDSVRLVRDALQDYIHSQIVVPLESDQSLRNTVMRDLRSRTQTVSETGRQMSVLNDAMTDVSRRGIKNLTDGLFSLSKNASATQKALHKELASLTRDLLNGILAQIRAAGTRGLVNAPAETGGGLLSGIFEWAGGLLGFRAGGGSVMPGQAFVVGEKGPELLVTGRTSGTVIPNGGVSGGAAAVNVTVINNAGAEVSVRERPSRGGGRELEIMVDALVAKSISQSGSKAFQAMEATYGLRPVLNGR
jgi:hypothetical protein